MLLWGLLLGAEPELAGEALGRAVQFSIVILILMFLVKGAASIAGKITNKVTNSRQSRLVYFSIAVVLALGAEVTAQEYLNPLAYIVGVITLYIWQFYESPDFEEKKK